MTHNKSVADPRLVDCLVKECFVGAARFNIGGLHRTMLDWNIYCQHDEDDPRLCLTIEFGPHADLSIWFRQANRMKDFLSAVRLACDNPDDWNGNSNATLAVSDDDDSDVFTLTMRAPDMERLYHNLLDGYRVVFEGESPRLMESRST